TGLERHRLPGKGNRSIAYAPDGRTLVSGAEDGVVHFWDAVTSQELDRPSDVKGYLLPRPYSRNGKVLVTVETFRGAAHKTAHVWDTGTGKEIRQRAFAQDSSVAPSPDGRMLAAVENTPASNKTIHLLDIATGQESLFVVAQDGRFFTQAFSPDGRLLALG